MGEIAHVTCVSRQTRCGKFRARRPFAMRDAVPFAAAAAGGALALRLLQHWQARASCQPCVDADADAACGTDDGWMLGARFGQNRTLAQVGASLGLTGDAAHGRIRRALQRVARKAPTHENQNRNAPSDRQDHTP